MSLESLLLFAAAAPSCSSACANDGGALFSSGLQLRSLSPLAAIGLLVAALVRVAVD